MDQQDLEQIREIVRTSADQQIPQIVRASEDRLIDLMQASFRRIDERFDAVDARFDAQATRMERHAALLQTGARQIAKTNDWAEHVDELLDRQQTRIMDLLKRVQRLEGEK